MWAFHSIDGWYLYTSSEHYRVHNCHVKSTWATHLSDTVSFWHKHITNPMILHTDKLMNSSAQCKHILHGRVDDTAAQEMCELQTIVHQDDNAICHANQSIMTSNTCDGTLHRRQLEPPIPRVPTPAPIPRVASPMAILPNNTIQ